MTSVPLRFYKDHGFVMNPVRVPDDIYTHVLDSFIIVCADIVIIDRPTRAIFLAKRRAKPAAGWWFIGGRMQPAETPADAARRNFRRETSLDLPAERFELVTLNRYWFSERKQEPQAKSCDTLGFTFSADLTPVERAFVAAHLDPDEYDPTAGLEDFNRARLVAERAHASIVDFYDLVFTS